MSKQTQTTLNILAIAMDIFLAIMCFVLAERQVNLAVTLIFIVLSALWCLGTALQISVLILRHSADTRAAVMRDE